MRRLIRKAARRDDQEQTTPPVPSAFAGSDIDTGDTIDGPPPIPFSPNAPPLYPGLDAVPNPVLFVRHPSLTIYYANPAAEAALAVSRRQLVEISLYELFADPSELAEMIATVAARQFDAKRRDVSLDRPGHEPLHAHAVVGALDFAPGAVLLELLPNEQKIRSEREERLLDLTSANKELIRNLAHEIKNPLGGIRGAAQLLEFELPERSLREYTQVIIKESDRLQTLVDRLLEPHRHPHIVGDVNIHEVLERVRSVVLAEFPHGLRIVRDYDASLPEFRGDKEQLIQAVLNIVHNAAHALGPRIAQGDGEIILRTRVARQVTIAKRLYKLALDLHVVDNGPGIPEDIRERIFFPLVSGREGGSGLGLTLAQTFVQQHDGLIECESRPGQTDFRILVPLH
ncbi:nitrogen regulation protein NR(II) [Ralstonia insidiosa]|jgi:two-component system nitrogen regulation sensor histidine kinase GlnL|uniref:nitrogen regulation protein NR(II) n=1 Tax=Ralstonia TaxID=48736 RepID=UPI0006649372|nr:nitrogen regulation protein NR(II) [Ralstonia insidiosa]KMW46301.1 histidine kinase [Ralstonia sp. MD27]MBX3770943.1 nitrogen regulation protein NR(II) [Ralstonia pickettii]NPA00204.1 nitrogen regulation protein NR(II) [Betaproteobacteria bacterium]MBA9855099.1 nitrogen regulation protein NR(II) [Ralstonia insidiosa]MBA9872037.1 nitrogen regulation protein NR(II) [Ralstonia insidiosa]